MEVLLVAFLIMNFIGFAIMGIDKQKAKKNQYRISENTLWMTALFGGAIGTTVGMKFFRHKTKHTSFKWGFPFLGIIELLIFFYLLFDAKAVFA
ncbi:MULTISPECIES: DUF1294 domain-containing protein [unclassified Bacillus (in: firmicutes)]|uniref:DUF1294 domain-containing protein n=1 Tax=unclassified Bacillus (in: firmicutes) TaxID=185979 RepID=UPI0008DF690A|nr:Uncharacterized membrane protein YsdA, DUF1294 family [Bacillus sp. UNCCL13]SFQ77592.1 Uncharacterized membrane protein YsdA, DUF1294 family [Bacillus sp. cl95]